MISMRDGMQHLEEGMKLAEASAGENLEVQRIVHSLLETIEHLTLSGRSHAEDTNMIGTVANSMQKAQSSLSLRVEQTRHTIGLLALLAGRFRVSADQ